jgi:hypothetical protein
LAVRGKRLDAFVKLVERHGVLEELPTELGLVVNIGDLGQGRLVGVLRVKLLRHGGGRVLELLEEFRGDGKEVNAGKGLNLANLLCSKYRLDFDQVKLVTYIRCGKKRP